MKVAIMQPYFFPYIGYFQLINAVDVFILYDDVNYINRGWINRNQILSNGEKHYITLPCIKASQNKKINEILINKEDNKFQKILNQIHNSYSKSIHYRDVNKLLTEIFTFDTTSLSLFVINSITVICNYLGIKTTLKLASQYHSDSFGIDKADRLIRIVKKENGDTYVNPIGGKDLYYKEYFNDHSVHLQFLETNEDLNYRQDSTIFIPWLSIIDVLMNNSKDEVIEMLTKYKLK